MLRAPPSTLALLALLAGAPPRPAAAAPRQPLVIIDAGHGGTNPGAYGPAAGVFEKKLTLAVARATAHALRARGIARVVLTRADDRYLTLQQRVQQANRYADATAFLSIHFNASPSRSRAGFEIFALTRDAADAEAQRLALRAGERPPGQRGAPNTRADVSAILVDLSQRAQLEASTRLAHAVRLALRGLRGKGRDRGLKQAPFDVLMGLRMPAVLVELGFIDHPLEGPELAEPRVQQQLAATLAVGLARFLRSR